MNNIYWARGVGHTKALLEGAKNMDGMVVIVAHTQMYADELARQCKNAVGIGLDNVQYLTGRQHPIVIDHLAIKILLDKRDEELERRRLLYLEGLADMAEKQRTQFARANALEAENEQLKDSANSLLGLIDCLGGRSSLDDAGPDRKNLSDLADYPNHMNRKIDVTFKCTNGVSDAN